MKVTGKEFIDQGAELNGWRAPLATATDEWGFWPYNNTHHTDGFGHLDAQVWYSY